jgi:hypothetical protein
MGALGFEGALMESGLKADEAKAVMAMTTGRLERPIHGEDWQWDRRIRPSAAG